MQSITSAWVSVPCSWNLCIILLDSEICCRIEALLYDEAFITHWQTIEDNRIERGLRLLRTLQIIQAAAELLLLASLIFTIFCPYASFCIVKALCWLFSRSGKGVLSLGCSIKDLLSFLFCVFALNFVLQNLVLFLRRQTSSLYVDQMAFERVLEKKN